MHLSSEIALDLLDGRLLTDREPFWKKHLEICRDCALRVNGWKTLGNRVRRRHLRSAPDADLQKAASTFPHFPQRKGRHIHSIVASIIFDNFADLALAGLRGGVAPATQLVMRAQEFDIHVKILGDSDHRRMLGQILPRNEQNFVSNARLHLMRNGERIETTAVDDMGEFHFCDVPEGDLCLQIDLPNLTVIGALNVKESL
jgi:hypothetical protein